MDYKDVAKHNTANSCWVILYDNVYDVTDFLPQHPGGSKIILKLAGKDATDEYDPVHPPGTLEENLPESANLGKIDRSTIPKDASPSSSSSSQNKPAEGPPPLKSLLNMDDIEEAATKLVPRKTWAYYYSAGDDLYSKTFNNTVYRSILLRPRVFVDCTDCSTATTFVSQPVGVPLFISPAAMARLAHPDGEHGMAKACAKFGAAQIISNHASMTPEQIVEGAPPDQVFGWQMYVNTDRTKSEGMLVRLKKLPQVKFLVVTLDAPVSGKREHDERMKDFDTDTDVRSAVQNEPAGTNETKPPEQASIATSLFAGTAPDLTWGITLPWLKKHTDLPIVLKGVQTHEDTYIASLHAPQVAGVILSNHGGRALDTAPPAIHTLLEVRKYCPEVFKKIDVFVDGGIKRGTDVVKALCLGAKGCGLGRAPLWGLGVGGQAGTERVFEILTAEIETCMRLLGVERIEELGPQHINTRAVEREIYDGPAGLDKASLWVQATKDKVLAKAKAKAKL